MKHKLMACTGACMAALSCHVSAVDTIRVGNDIWQCQNTCMVNTGMNGQMWVTDSQGGWAQMMRRGRIPVPNIAPTRQPGR